MNTTDCRSIFESQTQEADFYSLGAVIKSVKEQLSLFRDQEGHVNLHSFEITEQLILPIENLDDLFTSLFQETETKLNEEQRRYFLMCKRAIAHFYCYIQSFIKQGKDRSKNNSPVASDKQARNLAYTFYYNAAYELRNPYFVLKGFSQTQITESESHNFREYLKQIYATPIVPENQDKINEVSYWIGELGKFFEDLPYLWREAEDGAA